MGNALAALSGILGGLGGAPEGLIASDKQRLADEQLAETKRHTAVLEGQLNTPVGTLYKTLGLSTPAGVDETTTVPTSLASHAYGAIEKERARQAQAGQRSILDQALGKAATDFGTPGTAPRVGAMAEPEAAGTQPAPTVTPHPGISLLRQVIPGLDPEKVTPAVTELIKEMNPGGGNITSHQVMGPTDVHVYGTNKAGDVVKPPRPLGIGVPENKGPYTRADVEKLIQLEHTTAGNPNYGKLAPGSLAWQQRYNDLARTMILPQGGNAVGAGSGLNPNNTAQVPGAAPNSLAHTPTLTSDATVAVAADGVSAARFMRQIASDLRATAPDAQSRIALGARNVVQNLPVTRGVEFLSDQEAALATDLGHAQMRYERAMAGLRGAGSPQMYDRFSKMIGPIDKATTPAALDRLSQRMEDHISDLDMSERASGRAGFPSLLPQAKQRAQDENATRVKPQPQKWLLRDAQGQRKYYQPDAGEATPPAGWERVQ